MEPEKPKYVDTWKGKVLKAIAVDGAETWKELQTFSKLSTSALKKALSELMKYHLIQKIEGRPTKYQGIKEEILQAYRDYYDTLALTQLPAHILTVLERRQHLRRAIITCLQSTKSTCGEFIVSLAQHLATTYHLPEDEIGTLIIQEAHTLQTRLAKIQDATAAAFSLDPPINSP